jgi:hypothetical protein
LENFDGQSLDESVIANLTRARKWEKAFVEFMQVIYIIPLKDWIATRAPVFGSAKFVKYLTKNTKKTGFKSQKMKNSSM